MRGRRLKWLSKAIIIINWFSGVVQADVILAEHMSANVLNRRVNYMHRTIPDHRLRGYLESLPKFKLNAYKEKNFREHKSLGTHIAWVVQFQSRSGFEIEHRKTNPFPSQIGSPIQTFKDLHCHLLVWKNFSLQ